MHVYRNGGLKVMGYANRIVVDNTLDERLRLLEQAVSSLAFPPFTMRVVHTVHIPAAR